MSDGAPETPRTAAVCDENCPCWGGGWGACQHHEAHFEHPTADSPEGTHTNGAWDRIAPLDARIRELEAQLREARAEALREVGELRAALRDTLSALALTYNDVPPEGRPHWCSWPPPRHDATCSGMLHVQDVARAVLSAPSLTPSPAPDPE